MMIEPIPHADAADLAEQARPVDDAIDECNAVANVLGDNRDADTGDLLDQQLPVPGRDDDHPPAAGAAPSVPGGVFWPAWEFDSFTTRRSFIDDLASRHES